MKHKLHPCLVLLLLTAVFLLFGLLFGNKLRQLSYPKKYDEIVEQYAAEYELPISFVYAVIKAESGFDPNAESSVGAAGLMQIMPSTFQWLQELTGENYAPWQLWNPAINIRYGCFYLRYLYDLYDNKVLTLAAYNAGMGNVNKWLSDPRYAKDGNLTNIPFEETKNYINRVLRFEETYEALYPEKGQTNHE